MIQSEEAYMNVDNSYASAFNNHAKSFGGTAMETKLNKIYSKLSYLAACWGEKSIFL